MTVPIMNRDRPAGAVAVFARVQMSQARSSDMLVTVSKHICEQFCYLGEVTDAAGLIAAPS
jgi:hypothetical protein